jgi:hypothetical protein
MSILQKYKNQYLNIEKYIQEIDYDISKFVFEKFWIIFVNKYDILVDNDIIEWLNYTNEYELQYNLKKYHIEYQEYEYDKLINVALLPEIIKNKYLILDLNNFKNLTLLNDKTKDEYNNIEKLYNDYYSYQKEFLKLNNEEIIKNNTIRAQKLKKSILKNIYDILNIIENSINEKNKITKKKSILVYDRENILYFLEREGEDELLNDINIEIEKRNNLLNDFNELIKEKYSILERNYKSLNDINTILECIM